MTKEEFIAQVAAIVLPFMPEDATDQDKETVTWSAAIAWNSGCDILDAVHYCRTFEEVSPDLEEEEAFARRDFLREKYTGKARATRDEVGTNAFV